MSTAHGGVRPGVRLGLCANWPQFTLLVLVNARAFPAALMLPSRPLIAGVVSAALLGIGTAMVYPALIASVADHTHPSWRAQGLGVYRFWRDRGYAIGAVIAGLLAGPFGLSTTVLVGGALTFASGVLAAWWIGGNPRTPKNRRPADAGGPRSPPDEGGHP